MATIVDTNLLNTVAGMGLATLREVIQLVRRTNREYESDILAATPGSTVNVIVPAKITAVAVSPSHVPPGAAAITPTKVPITLDQWYRAPFAFDDKQAKQVARGIIPMQIQEAIRGLANKIDTNVWATCYPKVYGYVGTAGTTPFGTDISEFLDAEKIANDQLMPPDRRALIMDTAANANWKGLRRNYDRNFVDVGVDAVWTNNVPTHTTTTNNNAFKVNQSSSPTGYAVGDTAITVNTGTGEINVGSIVSFSSHSQTYTVTARTGTAPTTAITISPPLVAAVAHAEVLDVKSSHVVNLLMHPNAIAFAMAPMAQGLEVPGAGSAESTVVDNESGLALRLTVFRQYYQTEWSFDALWGSAVPRPELAVRIAG